jgi:2-C-methyl-D-erythritol 2,4-cyclodiphosphate synthase
VVGFGYDVHRFGSGRPLILGGIRIASELGLDGTSDADAVLHAVMDAVLGCAGAGDIGRMFPSSDEKFVGIDSSMLLQRVMADKRIRRLRMVSADITIVAERPRLRDYQAPMQRRIARLLGLRSTDVDVKVTGNDAIGWIGRGEGIASLCVVTALRPR